MGGRILLISNVNEFVEADYQHIRAAINYLKSNQLADITVGRYYPDRQKFYVQCLEYGTEEIENFNFEIHRNRLDLHYVVSGEERIDVGVRGEVTAISEYDAQRDIQYVTEPTVFNQIILHSGDFVLIGMNEPHRTNGKVDYVSSVKKLVLKLGR